MRQNISQIILFLALLVLPLLLALHVVVFNQTYYPDAFSRMNVPESLAVHNSEVLAYLSGASPTLPEGLGLDEREVQHMQDVKSVFTGMRALFALSLIVTAFLLPRSHHLKKILRLAGGLSILVLLLLLLLAIFSFETFFTGMHSLFFSQGTWTFPLGTPLVTLYPELLFFEMARAVFALALLGSALLFVSGIRKTI